MTTQKNCQKQKGSSNPLNIINKSNKERESHSLSKNSKSAKKISKSPPDIHLAIGHCKSEFQRIHGIENPEINGAECKVFQRLLKNRPIEKVNSLTTGYLSLKDQKLKEAGLSFKPLESTFYVWAHIPEGYSSAEFAKKLLTGAGIVGTPGNGFGPSGEGFIRFTLCSSVERLVEAGKRIVEMMK